MQRKEESLEYKERAIEAFNVQNFKRAEQHLSSAIDLDPENHVFYSNRAAAYMAMEKFEKALRAVSALSSSIADLSLAHSLSHVQTVEIIEDLAVRVDASPESELATFPRVSSADLVYAPASVGHGGYSYSREGSATPERLQVVNSPVIRRQIILGSPPDTTEDFGGEIT